MSKRIRVDFYDDPDLRHYITLALKDQGIRVSETRVRQEMTYAYMHHGLSVLVDRQEYCENNWNLSEFWDIG